MWPLPVAIDCFHMAIVCGHYDCFHVAIACGHCDCFHVAIARGRYVFMGGVSRKADLHAWLAAPPDESGGD